MKSNVIFKSGGIFALTCLVVLATALLSQGISKEVPVGRVEGIVEIPNGKAFKLLPKAAIILRPVTQDEDNNLRPRFLRADSEGAFVARNLPAGVYDVEVSTKAHDLPRTKIQVKVGETTKLDLKLEPLSPYLTLYANQHVFLPEEKPAIQLHGFVQSPQITIDTFSVPTEAIVKANGIYGAFQPLSNPKTVPDVVKSGGAKRISSEKWNPKAVDEEGTFREDIEFKPMSPGFYWVQVSGNGMSQGTYVLITNLGMAAKRDEGSIHLYVSELKSGKSVSDADVRVLRAGIAPVTTKTDDNGLATLALPKNPSSTDSAILAQVGHDVAVCTFRDYQNSDPGTLTMTYTDRPIYRPGDKVEFRSIMRTLEGSTYNLPKEATANVKILNSSDEILLSESKPVSAFGTINGEFTLPAASTEPVRIVTEIGTAKDEQYVSVAAYRKPAFKLEVKAGKPYYVRGDTMEYKVKAEYYFGGPVAGAKLSCSIYKNDLWRWADPESDDADEYSSGYGEFIKDFDAVTNDQGEAVIQFDSREIKWADYDQGDQSIQIEVSATEGSDQYFTGSGSARLMRGEFDLRLDQASWLVAPGTEAGFSVKLMDPNGNPIANKDVDLVGGYEIWDKKGSVFKPEQNQSVRTDADGKAQVKMTPPNPGDFRVEASLRDARGNLIKALATVWVWTKGGEWAGREAPDLQVTLDKKSYQIGETATALVRTSKAGGQAWVTLETDTVITQQLVDLSTGIGTAEFKVTQNLKPNAYVTANYISGKEFTSSARRLVVDLREERLNVTITPKSSKYEPGQEADYDVLVTNSEGKPVSAEFSLSVVDESIFAIAEDTTDPIGYFYPMRYGRIETLNSFPELYLDGGEKDAKNVELRKDFRDTASWMPTLTTDANGRTSVRMKLPDNLTEWRSTAIVVTKRSEFGKAIAKITVNKPLMVRLIGPMYLTEGDTQNFSVAITNSTDSALQTQVDLSGKGVTMGEVPKSVEIGAGKTTILPMTVTTRTPGLAILSARVLSGKFSDGMKLLVPVAAHGPINTTQNTLVSATGTTDWSFTIDPNSEVGELTLEAGNSPASQLIGSIEGLLDFPYGCVEQTLSRFVPALAVRQSFPALIAGKPDLNAKINEISAQSLARIRAMQGSEGGWGWFENEYAEPGTTSMAIEGLSRARSAGANVPKVMLERGLKWADTYLKSPLPVVTPGSANTWEKAARFDLAYSSWFATRDAYWIPAMRQNWAKEPTSDQFAKLYHATADLAVYQKLMKKASVRENLVFWSSSYGSLDSARALEAIQAHQPKNPDLEKIALGILVSRKSGGWASTLDTGLSILALQSYFASRQSLEQLSALSVTVNGKDAPVDVYQIEGGGSSYRLQMPISDLKKGENTISISGAGTYFANIQVRQTPFQKVIAPVEHPMVQVTRTFHRLVPEQREDGSKMLVPGPAATSFKSGEIVRCVVKVTSKDPMRFVMVEVPIPSNLKVVDSTDTESWGYWFSGMTILDDKVAQFASQMPSGTSVFEVNLRAEGVGSCGVLPARIEEMYSPDRKASTGSTVIEVTR